jgi:sigma-E factor negative regulatory protein RseC
MESRVANPVGAHAGDLVKVHLASENIFTGAAILYLVPILALLIGAFTGAWAAYFFGLQAVSGGLLGILMGLIAGFGAVTAPVGRVSRCGFPDGDRCRHRAV